MLTSKDLAILLAETPSGEIGEIAKKATGCALQQISETNDAANYANLLLDGSPKTSQTSHGSRSSDSVEKSMLEPFLAISQTSQCGAFPVQFTGDAVDAARALINSAPLTSKARESRLADLVRTPELAQFWLIVWGTESMDLPIDFGKIQRG